MFAHIPDYPGDPILSLMESFSRDSNAHKTNLGIGLYYDEDGRIPVMRSVRHAADQLNAEPKPHTYLPMEGDAAYRQAVQELVFGATSAALRDARIATIQSVGGSGAIYLAARFINAFLPATEVWISDPTWDNHRVLLESAGLKVHTYPYYDAHNNAVKSDAMLATLGTLPAGGVVLLQPSCHNPTGCDLGVAQFDELVALLKRRNLLPFVDMAYQGFGDGLDEDATLVRKLVDAGLQVIVSNSFSKNFSLYGERVGGLSIVCADAPTAARVLGQMKSLVRQVYSSPPAFGARIVAATLTNPTLASLWRAELGTMRSRMKTMRGALREALEAAAPQVDFRYLTEQRGMFSYTGLSAAEVDALRETNSIYLIRSGRICVAGLNKANIGYVAQSFADVVTRRTVAA
ncbi:aromatic amino acid aminotransferase (plasmid) [Paraburkholderia graminis]|uniref:amino acid aminotransferase n=1 Tax=Paraburkholderia graminis TaxID=60548 RepID=UPI000DEF14E1|nr:amino acid aminotransferase [Paraburkholderia graminis]AXF12699.1 aromatic amino acid aminotransferase [Paraburkholderia graminis]